MKGARPLLLAAVLTVAATPLRAKPREVYICWTTNVTGSLTTCDTCGSVTVGGMSQKAAVLAGWRRALPGPVVVLDAGNSMGFGAEPVKVQIMLKAMDACGYAVANVGDNEAAFGASTLRSAAKGRQVKWISANVMEAPGQRIFRPSTVIDVQGVKVGVVGILDPEAVKSGFQLPEGLFFVDPVVTASMEVSRLRKRCDIVVLLANAPPERMQALAKALPQVDIVAGGSQHPQIAEPALVGRTLIFQPGRYQIARVRMLLQKGSARAAKPRFAPSQWAAYTISKSGPRDDKVEEMISRALKPASPQTSP